ncbi:MAG: hypothetical protein AAGE80_06570 [Pseudomonadota bacterium]
MGQCNDSSIAFPGELWGKGYMSPRVAAAAFDGLISHDSDPKAVDEEAKAWKATVLMLNPGEHCAHHIRRRHKA